MPVNRLLATALCLIAPVVQSNSREEAVRHSLSQLASNSERERAYGLSSLENDNDDFVTDGLVQHLLSGRETTPKGKRLLSRALAMQRATEEGVGYRSARIHTAAARSRFDWDSRLHRSVIPDGNEALIELTQSADPRVRQSGCFIALGSYSMRGLALTPRLIKIMLAALPGIRKLGLLECGWFPVGGRP